METINVKILLEDYTDRRDNSKTYGRITATTFNINIFIKQNIENIGLFTDIENIEFSNKETSVPDYTILRNKLLLEGIFFPFMSGDTYGIISGDDQNVRYIDNKLSDYFNFGNLLVTGNTNSRLMEVQTYMKLSPYTVNFDVKNEEYLNYLDELINGVDRVTQVSDDIKYTLDGDKNDPNIGTINQKNGILYTDTLNNSTLFSFRTQGINKLNSSLSAITKQEYLMGIISPPEIKNDVFIDRGIVSVLEKHLKLVEVTNIEELQKYGRGYFNVS